MPITLATQFLFDEQKIYIEPPPMDLPDQSPHNLLIWREKNETQAFILFWSDLLDVEIMQAPTDYLPG